MKKIILIVLLSFVALSCSKDENNEPKVNFPEHLIGKWKMIACKENDGSLSMSDCQIQSTKNIYDIWFKADGTYFSKEHLKCNDICSYSIKKNDSYPDEENSFVITFTPKSESTYFSRKVTLLNINKRNLILVFSSGFDSREEITYTKVE